MANNKAVDELDMLAAVVHGSLAALHALSLVYNLRKRNHTDVIIHAFFLAYDFHAMHLHLRPPTTPA